MLRRRRSRIHEETSALARGRLPNFLIIGAAKGGTTSLHAYLEPHPQVYLPPEKELHFFDEHYEKGEDWYREQFSGARNETIVGEATPQYLYDAEAPARMRALVPDAKLVAILRHPVDRAYSHYWFQRSKYTSYHGFEEAVRFELDHPDQPMPIPHDRYLAYGRYIEQLRRVCDAFPRTSLLVILMDELRKDPSDVYRSICRFLGVDDRGEPPELGAAFRATSRLRWERLRRAMMHRRAWQRAPRLASLIDRLNRAPGYPPMDPVFRAELIDYFRSYNDELATWLGRDLGAWNR